MIINFSKYMELEERNHGTYPLIHTIGNILYYPIDTKGKFEEVKL